MKVFRALRNSKGFSLVELMVVVAIIGILAAIAVPNFQRFSAKSKTSEARANLSAMYGAEAAFYAEWAGYNSSFGVVGFKPQGFLRYRITNGAYYTTPANYAGALPAGDNSTSVAAVCGANVIGGVGCGEVIQGGVGCATGAGAAMVQSSYTSSAGSVLAVGLGTDTWTIDQNKNLLNTASALP